MKKIVMIAAIFVRGVMVKEDTELTVVDNPNIKNDEINEREAKELLNRGVAELRSEDGGDTDTTKSLEEMTKKELLKYAEEIGVEANNSMTNAAIIEAINAEDEE